MLDYSVRAPQGDPIAKDLCVTIDPALRNALLRGTYDAPRWSGAIDVLAGSCVDDELVTMGASAAAARLLEIHGERESATPQQVTVELNTVRGADGPIVPQHHVDLRREPLSLDRARGLFEQIAAEPDAVVTLGGLGDALLHEQWAEMVDVAREAGVWGIHLESDLLVERKVLAQLSAAPVDMVSVRINADTAGTYERLMGCDALARVTDNVQYLLRHRAESGAGLPWIVPRMVKTTDNVSELEAFFDRWTHFAQHAWVEGPQTGLGLIEDQSVLQMAPPRRVGCRQIQNRLTIHADGRAALCDQDWQCRGGDGEGEGMDVGGAWGRLAAVRAAHREGRFEDLPLCAGCGQWHRP